MGAISVKEITNIKKQFDELKESIEIQLMDPPKEQAK